MDTIGFKDASDAVIYLGAVAGAVTGIGFVLRIAIIRPVMRYLKNTINPSLATVRHEVTNNQGSSLKDDVTAIKHQLQELTRVVTDHIQVEAVRDREQLNELSASVHQIRIEQQVTK